MQKTSPQSASDSPGGEPSSLVGQVLLSKYRLHRELGRGGMGVVYAAEHLLLGQQVALKMMLPHVAQDPDAVARFLNEARAVARLENEHVARVMDVGLLRDGIPFFVLELLEGLDLADMLAASGPMPVARVVDYLLEAMEAIAEAHCAGIIHRDLKPSNLFVAERKGGASVKVLDFGISKVTKNDAGREQVITATNAILGSPAYMSPEQLRNAREIDARADIWSLGVIAYELLTGTLPYRSSNVVELFAVIQENDPRPIVELRSDVPAGLDEIVRRCLRRAKTDRWPSVLELATALTPFGSPGAKGSLSKIQMLFAEPVSVRVAPPSEAALPRARISVPDTDPNHLPSTTMLALMDNGARARSAPAPSEVSVASAANAIRAGVEPSLVHSAPPIWKVGVAVALAVLVAGVAAALLRSAPSAPAQVASPPAAIAPVRPEPAVSSPPAAAPAPPTPPSVTPAQRLAPPSSSLSPRAAPAPKSTPAAPHPPAGKSGVPADWN